MRIRQNYDKSSWLKNNNNNKQKNTSTAHFNILWFFYIFLFCVGWCLKLTACGWLKVSSEKLILSKTVTTPKNEQLKSSRNVTNSRGKTVLSFCFPCSFTIHVNSKLMRTIFYPHNKFTNYIFRNSPDILARLINLTWKKILLKEIG